MAEENKSGLSQQEKEVMLTRLNQLEANLRDLSRKKSARALLVRGGTIVLLLILGVFVYNLYSIYHDFDSSKLAFELEKQAPEIAQSAEVRALVNSVKSELIPFVKDEMAKKLRTRGPELKTKIMDVGMNLRRHVEVDLKGRVVDELKAALAQLEKDILKENPNIQPEKIELVFEEAKNEFFEQLAESIQKRLDLVYADLETLNARFDKIAESDEIKKLDPDMTPVAENRLLESFLELAIYQLNPGRGEEPASYVTPVAKPVKK